MWVNEKKKIVMDQVYSMKNDPLQECERNAKDLIQNEIACQITKFNTKNHLIFLTLIINMFTAPPPPPGHY